MKRSNLLAAVIGFVLKLLAIAALVVITIGGVLAIVGSLAIAAVSSSLALSMLLMRNWSRVLSAFFSSLVATLVGLALTYLFSSASQPLFFLGEESYREPANLQILAMAILITFGLSDLLAVALAPKRVKA